MHFHDDALFPEVQEKQVITVAPYGPEWELDDFREDLPLTMEQHVQQAVDCYEAGATVLHIHVRELDGKGLTPATAVTGTVGFVFNVLWLVTFGLALCLSYLALGIVYCLTIIGIPFGLQCFKLAGISLWPVGRRVVSIELAEAARRHAAEETFARRRAG